jgi:hypothetical protein
LIKSGIRARVIYGRVSLSVLPREKTLLNFSANPGITDTVATPATPAPAIPKLKIPFKAAPLIAAL